MGQPLEVTKTTMAANRGDTFATALARIWGRGGVLGCKFQNPLFSRLAESAESITDAFSICEQSTKVSFHGPGSKPPPKAPSSSSLPPKANTTPVPSAQAISPPVSVAVSWEVLRRHTLQWDSAPA